MPKNFKISNTQCLSYRTNIVYLMKNIFVVKNKKAPVWQVPVLLIAYWRLVQPAGNSFPSESFEVRSRINLCPHPAHLIPWERSFHFSSEPGPTLSKYDSGGTRTKVSTTSELQFGMGQTP
jgi:hypothetical protein